MVVHARTLELLAKLGVARTAVERGLEASLLNIYSDGKRLFQIDFQRYLRDSATASLSTGAVCLKGP